MNLLYFPVRITMKSNLWRALPLVSALLLFGGEPRAQSLEDVREVVATYFGPDEVAGPAQKRLVEWGNAALPALKVLADESVGPSSWPIVCCIGDVGTPESLDLLVVLLDGKTKVPPSDALSYLAAHVRGSEDPTLVGRLQEHPRFKPAIRALAESGGWLQRMQVAEVARAMRWTDFVPLLQEMLDDENVGLRKSAAAALTALTGRAVDAEVPPATFPGVQLIPGLVSAPTSIAIGPDSTATGAFLQPRPDGYSTLMLGDGRTFRGWPSLDDAETRTFSVPALDVLLLHREGTQPQYVALSTPSGFRGAGADEAISWSEDGQELWRYVPPRRGVQAAAVLADDEGPYGVALGPGGETGIVAIDSRGTPLWSVPRVHVLYDLETHPRLRGVMLVVHGQHSIARHSRAAIEAEAVTGAFMRNVRRGGESLYAHHGVLYPAADGAPEIVVSGMGPSSDPVLACFDASDARKWKVSLSERVTQLALLEIRGRERLLVVTTAGGELLLLNDQGVLRWRGLLAANEDGQVFVFQLVAGASDGGGSIAVLCEQGLSVYTVRGELLEPATR